MSLSATGWSLGTFLGVILGNILPTSIMNALGVALFAMFIAIIIPPAKKDKVIAMAVVISMASSWLFTKTPYLKDISSGFRIVIITVVVSTVIALLFPVESEAKNEK